MSSARALRDFIRERLAAAAEEIFSEFDKTIAHYEEELDRQRRLLEVCCKPQINMQKLDLPQPYVVKEEEEDVLTDCGQEMSTCLYHEEPEPQQLKENQDDFETLQIKEEEEEEEPESPQMSYDTEELCISPEKEQLEEETFIFPVNPAHDEMILTEPNVDQLLIHVSSESKARNTDRSKYEDSESSEDEEPNQSKTSQKIRGYRGHVDNPEVKGQNETEMSEDLSPCKVCGKVVSLSNLAQHMRIHTDKKPFSCGICERSFRRRHYLTAHIRTHTGEKPFSCFTCGKSFAQKVNLISHSRTHTGEKPFTCMTCGKGLSDKRSLLRHMGTHSGGDSELCLTTI